MINLTTTLRDVHEYLADKKSSTQIGNDNPFSCISMGQKIETINKDTQTLGGT